MGKRSDFKRVARDCYDTPAEAVLPLLPLLRPGTRFIEPCAGAGALVRHLEDAGMHCALAFDVEPRSTDVIPYDVFDLDDVDVCKADGFITNPPWDRKFLHALISYLRGLGLPAWLLLDANWMFTAQAAPFLRYCSDIVTIGRVKWIPGTTMVGKDDAAWFCFHPRPVMATEFRGKQIKEVSREAAAA